MKLHHIGLISLVLTLGWGCASSRQEDPYAEAWSTVLLSPEWKEAETANIPVKPASGAGHYALPAMGQISEASVSAEFMEVYPKLISRAYFRLIADALDADRRITRAYQESYTAAAKPENAHKKVIQQDLETARRRFLAHRRMLEGLRSWQSFNPYGSDDLNFYLQEQLRACYAMYSKGVEESRIIDYLMNGLADLYHKQGEGMPDPTL